MSGEKTIVIDDRTDEGPRPGETVDEFIARLKAGREKAKDKPVE